MIAAVAAKTASVSVRTPPGNRSEQRRKRKKNPVNLLCGEDETPATIGKFQRRRLPSPPAPAAAQDIAAPNDEFGNGEDGWDPNAIDRSVAMAHHQKQTWHSSRLLYQEPQHQIAAPNDEFCNDEDGWDLKATNRSVAMSQHQKLRSGHGSVADSSTKIPRAKTSARPVSLDHGSVLLITGLS